MPRLTGPMRGDAESDFERIRLLVRRRRGVDLAHYKASYVRRRLLARQRARRADGEAAYARLLGTDEAEISALLAALSTKVTQFFRNPGLYAFLSRRVLPDLLGTSSPGRTVRIWSAGCATGEEAWSLAALVEMAGDPPAPSAVRVIGTDVDREAVAKAKQAVYPIAALRRVPVEIQKRCFAVRAGSGTCSPLRSLQSRTLFRVESLLDPPAAGAFDLILCRNVLIYFEPALQHRILGHLAKALRPGGYLGLGRVERVAGTARASLEVVNVRERVYRRF
jgi:chemotaxis methyl-accepting protein methylase